MKQVIVIGTGGHAKVIVDIIEKSGDLVLGYFNQNRQPGEMILGYPVLGSERCDVGKYRDRQPFFVIGIGDNRKRQQCAQELQLPWYTAIHPSSQIGKAVKIGEGTVVMANAVVNSAAIVGKHCIINTCASIDHDGTIGDYVHVSPHAALAGKVQVGNGTHIGIGSSVKEEICICGDVKVGAGAVVVADIKKKGIYVGVPARLVKEIDDGEE